MPIAHMDLFPNALVSLFTLSLRGTSPPNLPFSKGRNVLSFSFTTIEFSLDKAFKWLCSTPLPLQRGEREGITYTELTYILLFYNCSISHFLPFHLFTFLLLSYFQIVTFLTFENIFRFLFSLQSSFSI